MARRPSKDPVIGVTLIYSFSLVFVRERKKNPVTPYLIICLLLCKTAGQGSSLTRIYMDGISLIVEQNESKSTKNELCLVNMFSGSLTSSGL